MKPVIGIVLGVLAAWTPCTFEAFAEEVVVSGKILGSESGNLLNLDAWVASRNASTGEWTRATFAKSSTGRYRLVLPEEGTYILYSNYGPFWHDDFNWKGADKLAARSFKVTLESGETAQDLTLPEPVSMNVRVLDAFGDPMEGATVNLSRMWPGYKGDWGALSIVTQTDADGRCRWLVKPGHEVWVSASAEGYTVDRSEHFDMSKEDSIPDITLTLRRPGTISATLVDENGNPKANESYRLTVWNMQGADLKSTWARTDANGQFFAPGFLVRDQLSVAVWSSSRTVPDFEMIFEGPADRNLNLGSIRVISPVQP